MGKPKYEPPTPSFPYKIKWRLNMLSVPRRYFIDTGEGMPAINPRGIRVSALRKIGLSDRVNDAAWPYLWRLLLIKRLYKNKFSEDRLEKIDRMIESSNATCYSKLANCTIDLKKQDTKDSKKKRGWTESEWKKHMDYINLISNPKKDFRAPFVRRGKITPLEQLLPRLTELSMLPDFKIYRRLSKETWYRDPIKVPRGALKYEISDRVKKLAIPRKIPEGD